MGVWQSINLTKSTFLCLQVLWHSQSSSVSAAQDLKRLNWRVIRHLPGQITTTFSSAVVASPLNNQAIDMEMDNCPRFAEPRNALATCMTTVYHVSPEPVLTNRRLDPVHPADTSQHLLIYELVREIVDATGDFAGRYFTCCRKRLSVHVESWIGILRWRGVHGLGFFPGSDPYPLWMQHVIISPVVRRHRITS